MKSKNNKGSAFVMVLVILAIVGVLAAVAMWVSLVNYQMKLTDVKVKNNFYSAESVLDQICVGLQGDVSEAYEGAYKRVLVDYMLLSDNERQTLFAKKYKDGIKKRLKMDSDADAMSYDIDKLKGYVWGGLQNSAKLPYAEIKVASGCEAANGIDGRMDTFESNIVLNGIEVTYTDEEGFTSIIQTNISIAVPEMKFSNADTMPDTFSYSLVGTEGISVNIPSTINGSVYAGVEDNEEVSLNLVGGVTFTNSQFLISTGTTKVGVGATLTVPRSAQLWTDNIVVDSGAQANLLGETFVADDLTLQGSSPKVTLGSTKENGAAGGKYVGFGTSADESSKSSAIILNGTNSLLDMSNLKEMLLGGYSYVKTSRITSDQLNPSNIDSETGLPLKANNDIQTGESIAIKSGQLAYLVPPECIGVDNTTGESAFYSNPITYSEYAQIVKNMKYTEIDAEVISPTLGKPLKEYLDEGKSIDSIVSTVFVPAGDNDGLVYYYVNLSANKATKYYTDYVKNAKMDKMNLYTDFYTDKIQFREGESIVYTAGNYTLFDENDSSLISSPMPNMEKKLTSYKDMFRALSLILSPDVNAIKLVDMNKMDTFDFLINDERFTEVVGSGDVEVSYHSPSGETLKAILTANSYTYDAINDPNKEVALIISKGNVSVNQNYSGTIIAKGNIFVNADSIETRNNGEMKKLLATAVEDKSTIAVYNVFNDGQNYVLNVEDENKVTGPSGQIAYSDVITYQKWTMK